MNAMMTDPYEILWRHRRVLALWLAGGFLASLVLMAVMPRVWEVRMTIAPITRPANPDVQAGGRAPYGMLALPVPDREGQGGEFDIYQTLIDGPRIATALLADKTTRELAARVCGCVQDDDKDPARLSAYLKRHLQIRPIGATALRRVTLRSGEKDDGLLLVARLHAAADQAVRDDARRRTEQRLAYLEKQLGSILNPGTRDALVALLKEQEGTRMMVEIDSDFAAAVIEAPVLSARPVSPNLLFVLPACLILGLAGGAAFVFMRRPA